MKILFMAFAIIVSSSVFAEKKVVKTKTKEEVAKPAKKIDSSNVERLLYGYKIIKMTKDIVIVDLYEDSNYECDKDRDLKYGHLYNTPLTKGEPIKDAYLTFLESTKVERLTFDKYVMMSDPLGGAEQRVKKYGQFKRLDTSIKNKKVFDVGRTGPHVKGQPLAVFPYKVKALKVYPIGRGEDVKATDYKYFFKFKAMPKFYNNCIKNFGGGRDEFDMSIGSWIWNPDSRKYSSKEKRQIYSKTKGYYLTEKQVRKINGKALITNLWNNKNLSKHIFDEVTILGIQSRRKDLEGKAGEIVYINNEFVHRGYLVDTPNGSSPGKKTMNKTHSITQKLNINGRDVYVIKELVQGVQEFHGYNYLFLYKNDTGQWRKTSLPDHYYFYNYFLGEDDPEY